METTNTNNPTTQTAREETFSERHARERLEESKALALVKAGDTVYRTGGGGSLYPVTITRVTDATIFIGSTQYKRSNGEERTRGSRDCIYPAIPRIVARYEAQEQAKADKLETERRRDYLREHIANMGETVYEVYRVGIYAVLKWEHDYDEGGSRYALYGKNEDEVYKRVNAGSYYSSLADAFAALAGANVTTDAERLALVRLVTGRG